MKIKRLHEDAILPKYGSEGASAFDVFAYERVIWGLHPRGYYVATVPTGWAFEIPHECGLFILSRSGHGFKHNTSLANSVGLLDYDYRGQLMVKLICCDNYPPEILAGQAVAQCALIETPRCFFMVSDELSDTERGENGFGHTDEHNVLGST